MPITGVSGGAAAAGGHTGAEIHKASNTAYVAGSVAVISFDTEDVDDANFWAIGSPTRLTIPAGGEGWYTVNFVTSFTPSVAMDYAQNGIRLNGATYLGLHFAYRTSAATTNISISVTQYLVAGDYLECIFISNVAGTILYSAKYSPYVRIIRHPK